ncbi:hypothetical protein [Ascidiaceihabitans sp.]|uniref:hypothetical protein n=1 Tax=Ascidiaceihabitans sp. TaxID=1872644 RepID=UPI003297AF2E
MSQNQTDQSGSIYQTGNGKPAIHGQPIKIVTANGPISGTMQGGCVVADKK